MQNIYCSYFFVEHLCVLPQSTSSHEHALWYYDVTATCNRPRPTSPGTVPSTVTTGSWVFKFKTTTRGRVLRHKNMRPEKTESFTFRKHATGEGAEGGSAKMQNCRRKLQDRFEQSENGSSGTSSGRSGVVSGLSLEETRRALRNGSERVSRALSSFRTSLGSFSQVVF